jgi:hypothetical protein
MNFGFQFQYLPVIQNVFIDCFLFFLLYLVLVSFAGLCSGLTVGYLSINYSSLEIKLINGTDYEKAIVQ